MKILYVTTISGTLNAFLVPQIKLLLDSGHKVDIACNITDPINKDLIERGCRVFNIGFQRSPLRKQNFIAYKNIQRLVKIEKYDVIHTHTPVASACVRLACRKYNHTKIIYTAHGFHFFNGAPLKNWLIYYPIEYWLSRYTDILITINMEDYKRAKKSFKAKRTEYILGVGLDIKKFRDVVIDKNRKRQELGLPANGFIVLSVGELNKNKNHETIIKAISKIKNDNIYYVVCGRGSLKESLTQLANKLVSNNRVLLLGHRKDIDEIYKVSDVFVFPSRREGLGMAALEAMSSGLPIITSNIHGIIDYSIDNETGFVCGPNDIDCYADSIKKIIEDKELRNHMGNNNIKRVERFELNNILTNISNLFNSINQND